MHKLCPTACLHANAHLIPMKLDSTERRRRRRRRLVEKLTVECGIDVDDLRKDLVADIIDQFDVIERKRKMRERAKTDCRTKFIGRLLQEERYKRRCSRAGPGIRKRSKQKRPPEKESNLTPKTSDLSRETTGLKSVGQTEELPYGQMTSQGHRLVREGRKTSWDLDNNVPTPSTVIMGGNVDNIPLCSDLIATMNQIGLRDKERKTEAEPMEVEVEDETHLVVTPGMIVFENCDPDKSYCQSYRITNVGLDVVHCRYVAIKAPNDDGPVPLRVDAMDNTLLRPGLSLVSKVRLLPQAKTDGTERQYTLLYETRRRTPSRRRYFRVPVALVPAMAIVEVTPTTIRFDTVAWSTATEHYQTRTLRIRNTGAKPCSCSILTKPEDGDAAEWDAKAIVEELTENVFEHFRFSQKYHIPVPASSVVQIKIEFVPEYRGYHHEVAFVRFDGADNRREEKIELVGDVKKVPLRCEPPTIDLGICMINSGVYEGVFRVYNQENGPLSVLVTVPKSMRDHAMIFPRYPIIQASSWQVFSVRLFPRVTIAEDAFRYYKEDTKVLEFPVTARVTGSGSCKSDRVKLYVFAILTGYELELSPPEIDFGTVTTMETVRTGITLTNNSMAPQEFGFLNLPMGVRIEPNGGFGTIFPKETIPLDVLLSPVGDGREMNFRLRVTSIAELGGFGEKLVTPNDAPTEEVWDEELTFRTNAVAESAPKEITDDEDYRAPCAVDDDDDEEECHIDEAEQLRVLEEKQNRIREYLKEGVATTECRDEVDVTDEKCQPTTTPRRSKAVECRATVVNPHCQLSPTVILMPSTPVSSFSVVRFRLSCRSGDGSSFQFATSSPTVSVEPVSGCIARGETIPLAIVVRPEFTESELRYQSRVMKAEAIHEEELRAKEASTPPRRNKARGTKPVRQSKVDIETQEIDLSGLDVTQYELFAGERLLQQVVEPFRLVARVTCDVRSADDRSERHVLVVVAPVVKPSFTFLGPCQEISFGKVVIGATARRILEVQNISLRRIAPRVTALNPSGPFRCTTGWRMDKVDPEHIWRHPLTFAPTAEGGKECEFFEISHDRTRLTLAVNGEGIQPRCAFVPDFALCLMEGAADAVAEAELSIENQCDAELRLRFVAGAVKSAANFVVGALPWDTASESRLSDGNAKKGGKKTSQTAKDSIGRRVAFVPCEVPQEIASQLEAKFHVAEDAADVFAVVGLDLGSATSLSPLNRTLLKVKFSPPAEDASASKRGDGSSRPRVNAYAVKYKVMLSATTVFKELTIIGTLPDNK